MEIDSVAPLDRLPCEIVLEIMRHIPMEQRRWISRVNRFFRAVWRMLPEQVAVRAGAPLDTLRSIILTRASVSAHDCGTSDYWACVADSRVLTHLEWTVQSTPCVPPSGCLPIKTMCAIPCQVRSLSLIFDAPIGHLLLRSLCESLPLAHALRSLRLRYVTLYEFVAIANALTMRARNPYATPLLELSVVFRHRGALQSMNVPVDLSGLANVCSLSLSSTEDTSDGGKFGVKQITDYLFTARGPVPIRAFEYSGLPLQQHGAFCTTLSSARETLVSITVPVFGGDADTKVLEQSLASMTRLERLRVHHPAVRLDHAIGSPSLRTIEHFGMIDNQANLVSTLSALRDVEYFYTLCPLTEEALLAIAQNVRWPRCTVFFPGFTSPMSAYAHDSIRTVTANVPIL